MKNQNLDIQREPANDFIQIDFRKLFSRMLSFWWLFVLFFGISMGAAQLYLRYTTFEYSARAVLLIKDAGRSGNISAQDILSSSDALSSGKAMDNEIQILKSLTLVEKVVDRLNLHINYFRIGNIKETELYKSSPFLLDSFDLTSTKNFGTSFLIELYDYESFLLKLNEDDVGVKYYFGVPFENAWGRFKISRNPEQAIVKGNYRMDIRAIESVANSYRFRLNIKRIGDQNASSVLELNMLDPVGAKASDFLNTLIDIYNEEEIKDENKVLDNTLVFINNRVAELVNELDSVEGGIQRYKSDNEIISEDASSSMNYTLGEIRSALQQISNFEIQKNILSSLENFLTQDDFKIELIPANLVADNPAIGSLVGQYNEMVIRNKQIAIAASEKNPTRIALEEQIGELRGLMLKTIQNQQKTLQIPIKEIEENIRTLKRSMSSIPGIEKKLIEKMRTQEVKEQLFLFLLQKREETALSEAVATAKTRTIDQARIPKYPVYPKPKLIKAVSGVLGLIVPLVFVLLLGLFDNKIDSEDSIKQITSIPIMGRIGLGKGKKNIVVKYGSRSAINEMFRLLRTNLNFINNNKPSQIMMVTSSISGEGKTFIVSNLGITLSLAGKKVILLGMDLRKPKLGTYLGAGEGGKGITNYLVGESSLAEIIKNFEDNPNLQYITSGPMPPNPGELILSKKLEELIKELSTRYDYILIDTPPMGLVSDALLLRKFVDNILVVVHHKVTRKIMVRNLQQMYQNNELPKASIIYNGIKQGKKYYGFGGYYYGKKQGYYVEED